MNDSTSYDALTQLRRKCEQDIKAKELELSLLRAKLNSIKNLSTEANNLQPLVMPDKSSNKYADGSLVESIVDSIKSLWGAGKGTTQGISPSQIRQYLIHHGYPVQQTPRNYTISVNTALTRLFGSKRLVREDYLGKVYYRLPEE